MSEAPLALVYDPPMTLPPVYTICKTLCLPFATTDTEPPVRATPVEVALRPSDHLIEPPDRSGNDPPESKLQRPPLGAVPVKPDK
ncbi:MAG: hypothetical protein ACLPVY_22700 [Acidimicrobiia bacterium]